MTDHGLANARNEKFSGLLGKLTVACAFDEITKLEWYQLLQYELGMKAVSQTFGSSTSKVSWIISLIKIL